MTTSNALNIYTRYAKTPAAKSNTSSLMVQKTEKLSPEVSRVVFGISGDATQSALEEAVAVAFDGKLRLMNAKPIYHTAAQDSFQVMTAFVGLNKATKAYDAESVAKMNLLTANVFSDADDNIWGVVGSGEDRMLVAQAFEDIDGILSARKVATHVLTASLGVPMNEPFKAGEAIAWFEEKADCYAYGVAIDSNTVVRIEKNKRGEKLEASTVNPVAVVAIIETNDAMSNKFKLATTAAALKETANLNGIDPLSAENMMQRHMQYMSVLYSGSPDYLDRLHGLLVNLVTKISA
jgi:hypothetical protein